MRATIWMPAMSVVLSRLGATTVNLSGGEMMSALQSEVNDAAEWGETWMDLAFGLIWFRYM